MKVDSKRLGVLLAGLFVLVTTVAWQAAVAKDVVHAVSGIVKSVDKGSKTMVVKTSDGTEHTIKWTDETTVKGVDSTGKAVAAGPEARSQQVVRQCRVAGVAKGGTDDRPVRQQYLQVLHCLQARGGARTIAAVVKE